MNLSDLVTSASPLSIWRNVSKNTINTVPKCVQTVAVGHLKHQAANIVQNTVQSCFKNNKQNSVKSDLKIQNKIVFKKTFSTIFFGNTFPMHAKILISNFTACLTYA
jgi:hypothetical protein